MRVLLVAFLFTLLVAAHLQRDAIWWLEAQDAIRAEANADRVSLREDSTTIWLRFSVAPVWVKSQWEETQSDLIALRADASADAKMCAEAFKRTVRRIYSGEDE